MASNQNGSSGLAVPWRGSFPLHTGLRPPEVRRVSISVESGEVEGAGEVVEVVEEASEIVADASATVVGTTETVVETSESSTEEEPSAKGVIAALVVPTRRRERRDNLRKECRDADTAILVREVGK